MAKRKPSIQIEEVLPDDNRLSERGNVWKSFMDKYANKKERSICDIEEALNILDYEPSDHSDVSDVKSDNEADDDLGFALGNREDFDKKLEQVVAVRKSNWAKNGLLELMESIEDPGQNMLSHEKVEKWLFNQNGPFDMTQANETVMTEQDADGGRREYHRKQQVTVSRGGADDADSLYSVDTAKYILQNTKERHSTRHIKIKTTTMIKQYTISTNNSMALRPNLHSISSFPIEEEPSTSRLLKTSKSDSAFETGEDQSQNRSNERNAASKPSKLVKSPLVAQPEKPSKRKKVFKKTVKKSSLKSPSSKGSTTGSQQYEKALKACITVKKVPHPKSRRIHWLETSNVNKSSSSSTDDESDEVFNRVTRSKAKGPSKRDYRERTNSRSSVTPELSPRKKPMSSQRIVESSPGKTVDRELLDPFESICLSPTKRISKTPAPRIENYKSPTKQISKPQVSQQVNKTIDQTANLTALFSAANEKITNSTEIANSTVSSQRSTKSGTYWNRNACGYPDESRSIVVYQPKQIQPDKGANDSVRITYADLTLEGVNKPRHLEKFKTFNYLIHPNSTVRFFPSDSEEDGPARSMTTITNAPSEDDSDESFDDDDPILTFNPRENGRLNVIEYPYKGT